ncbi:MAG TPA: ABC transporter permease [Mycobacteriales bacterium]|nr:ABC transporter permease [Mycobacteriales bacterium]
MTAALEAPAREASAPPPARGQRRLRLGLVVLAGFLVLSLVRVTTGASDLTSGGTAAGALRLTVPIGLAALGGLWAERAGVVNIGLEGMMILGTWSGAFVGYQHGPWAAVAAGALGGALGGLVHAVATVTFGVDHVVSGVAINILAAGLVRYLSVTAYANVSGGGPTQSPNVAGHIGTASMPVLAGGRIFGWSSPDALAALEGHHWYALSDAAGLLGGLLRGVSWFTVLAAALVPLSAVLLWRTPFGLRLRSVGESPAAAESLGVGVYRMKYAGVVISGALAGLAGAFLVTVASDHYQQGQTGGRGYIGLAALIFGNWLPGALALGSGLFGYSDAVQLRQASAVHALLLFAGLLLVAYAGYALARRRKAAALGAAVAAAAALLTFALTSQVAPELTSATPYVVTLLVLALAAQRLRPPAADGLPFRRGERT